MNSDHFTFRDLSVAQPTICDDGYTDYVKQKRRRGLLGEADAFIHNHSQDGVHIANRKECITSIAQSQTITEWHKHKLYESAQVSRDLYTLNFTDKSSCDLWIPRNENECIRVHCVREPIVESAEPISEALNMMQRMRRRAIMRKNKGKIMAGRRRAQRRHATMNVLQSRAMRAARNVLARKMLRKSLADASYSEKVRVEKILAQRKAAIQRIARKMIPVIRQREMNRFKQKPAAAKPVAKPPVQQKPAAK